MKSILTALFTSFLVFTLASQNDAYWQQQVDYRIEVSLDDTRHVLSGNIEIQYRNNSPDTLREIWMHLWGNAFSRPETAFGRQKVRNGSSSFYFAEGEDRGGYSQLDFKVDGQPIPWGTQKKDPDIALLKLSQPLPPGGSIAISTPFELKIPASFSRLGHVGTSYQVTQWYPKPAVYDRKGWHPMPYLDMGEFYSEFGNFDVSITLPENYVVGATGVLRSEAEKAFLKKKVEETEALIQKGFPKSDSFPPSAPAMKTLRYTAENVHDFAWFADKRFHVLKGEVVLPSGKKVDTWAMFTNEQAALWTKATDYIDRAVLAYSQWVGEYPWPHATAVQSALSAGAGMEYPMITVIGRAASAKDLDQVITHEVGHNWFYGILATNERDHAWMDEGINSFYEYRYTTQFWGSRVVEALPGFLARSTDADLYELAYLYTARRRLDQAPDTPSDDFDIVNYGTASYIKTGSAFRHLEGWLGQAQFDAAMQEYFRRWQFRHPYPEDVQAVLEQHTGQNLDWFFGGYLLSTAHYDYAIGAAERKEGKWVLRLCNRGEIAGPVPVTAFAGGEEVKTVWYDGFAACQEVDFPDGDFDLFRIDAGHQTLDVYRKNNTFRPGALLPAVEPFKARLAGVFEDSRSTTLNAFPLIGGNHYDGFMAGLVVHNGLLPARHFNYRLAGFYGTASGYTPYLATVEYRLFPKQEKWRELTFGLSAKSFTKQAFQNLNSADGPVDVDQQYRRLMPYLRAEWQRSPKDKLRQTFQYRLLRIGDETLEFAQDTTGFFLGTAFSKRNIHELSWSLRNEKAINPWSLQLTLEQSAYDDFFGDQQHYLRSSLEWKSAYTYDQGRQLDFRLFIGGFLDNSMRERGIIAPGAWNLTAQGFNDYRYDELYFGRSETSGFLSQQISTREGGMKVALGSPFSEGRSNDFIIALNLSADLPKDLPGKLPLRPYFDLGYYSDQRPISSKLTFEDQLWWQGGFTLGIADNLVAIHFPVINSGNVNDLYKGSGRDTFWKRITFQFDLTRMSPWKMVENLTSL